MATNNSIKNEYFKTTDLHLACAISLFYPVDSIEDSLETNRSYFIFIREEGMDELVQQYWQNTLTVSPQQYAAQLRILKNRLYELRGRK